MADISPDLFMDAVLAYQQTAAIKAALELDLFSEIAKGNATAESIAQRTGAAFRGIRILCDYLTVRGHLEKQRDQFRLTPSTAAFLDRTAPSWMGSVVDYLAAPEMMDLFLKDPAVYVRSGGSMGLANDAPDHASLKYPKCVWVPLANIARETKFRVTTVTEQPYGGPGRCWKVEVTLITGESAGIASSIPACHFDFPESELWVRMKSGNEYVEPLQISDRVATPCTE